MLPPTSNSVCPSSIVVQKENCGEAGSAVGGILGQEDEIVEGSWIDRPSGCSFGPEIQYNSNPNGREENNHASWHPICHKMEVRYQLDR